MSILDRKPLIIFAANRKIVDDYLYKNPTYKLSYNLKYYCYDGDGYFGYSNPRILLIDGWEAKNYDGKMNLISIYLNSGGKVIGDQKYISPDLWNKFSQYIEKPLKKKPIKQKKPFSRFDIMEIGDFFE